MRTLVLLLVACGGSDEPTDDAKPCEEGVFYADADGDGYGDPFAGTAACEVPEGHVDNRDDCDDEDADEYPGKVWHRDVDGDGYGDASASLESCHQPVGYIADANDCDDEDSTRKPDGLWYVDGDEDGFGDADQSVDSCGDVTGSVSNALDCDDSDWLIHPDANEICDGLDNDCDAAIDDDDPDIDVFTQVPVFRDDDGDGYGTDELIGRACRDASTGAEFPGDCDDSDASAYPHRLDYSDDHDADCDGEAAFYDVSSSEGGWIGSTPSSAFGMHLKSKDVDGDGLPELLVGGHAYDTELDNVGSISYIPGSTETDRSRWPDEGRWWSGIELEGKFGYSFGFAGDWDGDGVEDIVASAPYFNDDGGVAYIFSSEMTSESMADAMFTLPSAGPQTWMGTAMAGVGDINDDGLDDVLISARKDDYGGSNRGSVTVVLGGSDESTTFHRFTGLTNSDQLGWDIVPMGDMDGDGVEDVAISAPYGQTDEFVNGGGEVVVIPVTELMSDTAFTEESTIFYGNQYKEYVGYDMAELGDFNGDGVDDLLIGAGNHDLVDGADPDNASDEGAAYVVLGSGTGWDSMRLEDSHVKIMGTEFEGKLGRYVGGPGDIDGDGLNEAFAVSHVWDGVEENMGMVVGVMGGHEGGIVYADTDADLLIVGEGKNDYIGRGIAPAGDVNSDGIDDFWMGSNGVGSYGILYLVQGAARP